MTVQAHSAAELQSPRAKFLRIANGRMERAVEHIRLVERLGAMHLADSTFTLADRDAMIGRLRFEVETLAKRLNPINGHQLDVEFGDQ